MAINYINSVIRINFVRYSQDRKATLILLSNGYTIKYILRKIAKTTNQQNTHPDKTFAAYYITIFTEYRINDHYVNSINSSLSNKTMCTSVFCMK